MYKVTIEHDEDTHTRILTFLNGTFNRTAAHWAGWRHARAYGFHPVDTRIYTEALVVVE